MAAAIVVTVAAASAGVMPADAAVQDTEGPLILTTWISHNRIDVIDGPVQVTVRVEVQDQGSGLAAGSPWLDPVTSGFESIPGQSMALVSGDRYHGTYETTFSFPEFSRSGDWAFVPRIIDLAGNSHLSTSGDAYGSIGLYPSVVSVVDGSAPRVTTTLSKNIVDITDGPARAVLSAKAYDDGIGIPADARIMVDAHIGSSSTGWYVRNSSADPHMASFGATLDFSKYSAEADSRGLHKYWITGIADGNGNSSSLGGHYVGEVMVATRPLRAKRPDLRASDGIVTASWAAHTDLLGIYEYETEFAGQDSVRSVRTSEETRASVNDLPAGTYTARVRARNRLGWGEWTTASDPLVHTPGTLVGNTPTVSGTATVGQMLSVATGTWNAGTTFAYQWLADGAAVTGANSSTLVLGPDQSGTAITARITASKPGYLTQTRTSEPTAKVGTATLAASTPTVSGTATVGRTLSVAAGTWSAGTMLAYQWLANGTAVPGATSSKLVLGPDQDAKTITVRVTGSKTGYTTLSKTSAATAAVTKGALTVTPVPAITGTTKVGSTLTADPGVWGPVPVTLKYQWYRSGVAIIGANAAAYRPTSTDIATSLTVKVTGSKPGYTTFSRTSAPTAAVSVGSLARSTPIITGTTKVGSTLTADPGVWGPVPVTLKYQWYRSGVAIIGANAAAYRPTSTDIATSLTVKVTGSKPGYTTFSRTSAPTAAVSVGSLARSTPIITGTTKVGSTLTADPGVWGPVPVTLKYQWYRSGVAIIGANAAAYRPTSTDIATSLTVKVTGSKPGYTTFSRTSAPTAAVAK